jgi:GNAT superfamily N-acetyltransferase
VREFCTRIGVLKWPLMSGIDPVIAAVEKNVAEWTRLKGCIPGVELHDDGDAVWVFSTQPGRGGAVAGVRFTEETADGRIAEILAHHRRHLEPTLWWTGPVSTPTNLDARLQAAGLYRQQHLPGMAADLQAIRTEFHRPAGLTVEPVEDFSIFQNKEHPFFGPTNTKLHRNRVEGISWMVRQEPRRAWHFVASLDGVPAGCATVFLGAGVAGLYHVGTVQKARGQGVGKAVTLAALEHARDLGVRTAILHASKDGEVIYRQIGFEEVCKVSHWYYSKTRQMRQRLIRW